jgi:hypothetical protein
MQVSETLCLETHPKNYMSQKSPLAIKMSWQHFFNPEIAYQRRQRENQLQHYRSLIKQDILNYKDWQFSFGCKVCKTSFEFNKPNVDHCGTMEFRHIVKSPRAIAISYNSTGRTQSYNSSANPAIKLRLKLGK